LEAAQIVLRSKALSDSSIPRHPDRRSRVSLWVLPIFWAALIAVATSLPGSQLPGSPFPHFDLLVHLGMYGGLAFLFYRLMLLGTRFSRSGWTWVIVLAAVQAYGILDEIHQLWIPNRTCDVVDALADGLGAAIGIGVYFVCFVRPRNASAEKEPV
jgi:VanZ family protein